MKAMIKLAAFALSLSANLFAQTDWFWQNPRPQGNTLGDIHVFDQNTALAVGETGTVMKTTDGGINWHVQHSAGGTSYDLYSVYFTDANTGWVVGCCGTILKTTNGGSTWSAQTSGTTDDLYSVHFTDANTGWAVGFPGTILKTTNGGSSWSAQTSGTTNALNSVYFTDANIGWAVGFSGTILKTTNGGSTWSAQTSGTTNFLESVYFTDANIGWAVGEGGTILKTTNGGSTWSAQTSGTTEDLTSVSFIDANIGWAVGEGGTILRTTNGGSTWSAQTSGTTSFLLSVYFTDANSGWAVGVGGTILRTTNGGSTWSAHTSGTTNVLYSVYFTDANTGWAAGEVGTILKTTNGGSIWSAQTSGTTDILRSLYFTDANTGWAVGGDGTILKTTNGGNTWAAQTSGTTSFLLSAYFTDANTGWAVGDFGTILKTTNGGSTWSAQTSRTIEDLYSVYFTDVNTGWAVGGFGTILKTTNGGSTWSAQTSGTTSFLLSVYFTDANTGWVVGELGTILKTTRGETAILNVDVQELSISAKPEQTGSAPFKISNIGTAPLSFNIGASSQFVSVSSGNAIPELSSFKSADETAPLPGNHAQAKPQAVKAANMQMAKSPAPAALGNDVLVLDDGDSTSSFFLGFNNGASFYWSNVFNLAGAGFMLEQIRFYMRTQSASANPVYIGVLNAAGEALVEGTLQMKLSTIGEWYAVNLTSPLSFNAGESFRLVIGADGAISHPAGVDTSGQVRDNSFYSGQPKNGFVNLNTVPGFENGAFLIRAAGTKTGGGNQPPVARAIASASQAKVNEPITFDASQSFDPDGQITEYLWNFGDNTTSNQKVATHAYAQAGNYLVQLTVTDDMGATGQAVRFLTIIPGGANRLAVNPTSGTIAPGGAQTINVTFNAQGLTEGNYQGQIDIASNGGNRTIPVRIRVSNTTGVDDNVAGVPAAFRLEQNYPNPFNPETSIRYELPNNGNVTLAVFELNGRRVALLESGLKTAGQHLIRWDGRDQAGIRVPSGIYFYRLEATTAKGAVTTLTKKLTVLK